MILLALDTTSASGSAAVLKKRRLLAEISFEAGLDHSGHLLPAIHCLLQACRLDIKDVEAFAAAVGPGSFTGIRVGLSTVKGFAFAGGKPAAPVSALEALTWKMRRTSPSRLYAPIIDAKKGEIYAALFEEEEDGLKTVLPQAAYTPDDFLTRLPGRRVVSFLGNGVAVTREKILAYLKDKARFVHRSLFIAHEIGLIGMEMILAGRGVSSEELRPLYFRKSQAEE